MTSVLPEADFTALTIDGAPIIGSHRRTLQAIFHHPAAQNLKWVDVIGLIDVMGHVHKQANDKFVFEIAKKRQTFHKPHDKDLTSIEVEDVRHFLMRSGSSPEVPSQASADPSPLTPNLLVVVDHHGTRIFKVDVAAEDPMEHSIRPYDPHHFLHHLVHKDQLREQGQRAPEEPAYYEKIADAVALGARILIVGHGKGKSNAAHHLAAFLLKHHRETYQRVVREIDTDLSSITEPQLLVLAREALRA